MEFPAVMTLMKNFGMVMIGGGFGAGSRYAIALFSAGKFGTAFPWGTFTANLIGCFLMGLLFGLTDRIQWPGPDIRLLLMTGYLGALTTFSTFSLETIYAVKNGMFLTAFTNVLLNNLGGFSCTLLGMGLVGLLTRA